MKSPENQMMWQTFVTHTDNNLAVEELALNPVVCLAVIFDREDNINNGL